MKHALYLNKVIIAEITEGDDVQKAKQDYALIHNVATAEIKTKLIPENIVEADMLKGH